MPSLNGVTLEVRGGVAVLRGEVPSLEARIQAAELALKIEGVITVDNGLVIESDVRERISPALAALYERGMTFLAYLPLLGVAVVIFFLFVSLGRAATGWNWLFAKLTHNIFVRDLLKQGVYLLFSMIGALIALELLNATALVGAVLGTAGVLGVALGFAFKDLAENSLASILLSIRQPFAPNDHVVIDGQEGKIVRLTSRATILLTLEGNHLRIPNAAVFKASILNYTRNPERRFLFRAGIDTDESLPRALSLAQETLKASPGVLASPAPQVIIDELGESSVNLVLTGWVNQREAEFLKVRSEAIRRVKEAFDVAGVLMPEPIYKVRLEQTEPRSGNDIPTNPEGQESPQVDLNPDTHLEEKIGQERLGEGDLLTQHGRPE